MTQQEIERACRPQVGDTWIKDGLPTIQVLKVDAGIVGLLFEGMRGDWTTSIEDYELMARSTIRRGSVTFIPASGSPCSLTRER